MNTIARGALAGALGTGVMSLAMAAGRASGLMYTPPPKQITANLARRLGIRRSVPKSAFTASWAAAHVGYGAAAGVLYAAAQRYLPGPTLLKGTVFGLTVWALSYFGLLPKLRLYPSPGHDAPPRLATMVAAHIVFGSTTALVETRWAERRPAR